MDATVHPKLYHETLIGNLSSKVGVTIGESKKSGNVSLISNNVEWFALQNGGTYDLLTFFVKDKLHTSGKDEMNE